MSTSRLLARDISIVEPGVYEWIQVIAGTVEFKPGIDIIRGVSPAFRRTIYAKWVNFQFIGDRAYDMPIVAGSVRFVSTLGLTVAPSRLLPPAHDVFLAE